MSNAIDLPADVKKGDPVKAEDYNKLLAALRRSIIQPGTGYLRTINKSGTTLRIKENKEFRPRINPPFSVIEVDSAGGNNYNLRFEPGRVSSANPEAASDGDDGIDYQIPKINGTPMDQKDANGDFPALTVEDGFSVYCRIRRTAMGVLINPVDLVAADRTEVSGHYFPPDPDNSGTEEVYQYRRILDLDVVSGEVEIKVWRRSDIDLEPYLWTGDNVGQGVDVFKEHDEENSVYNFYRVNGCYGLKGALDSNSIKLDFEGENIGASTSGTKANVYVEYDFDNDSNTCADKAQFRPLTQGAAIDRQQIQVVGDNEVVRIQGNNIDKKIIFQDCSGNGLVTLEFEDGLLKDAGDAGDVTIQVPSCGSSSP
jgi:hypothetical protein